jgi:hypothetical protein
MKLDDQVRMVRRMHREGYSLRALSAHLDLDAAFIADIVLHQVFASVPEVGEDETPVEDIPRVIEAAE